MSELLRRGNDVIDGLEEIVASDALYYVDLCKGVAKDVWARIPSADIDTAHARYLKRVSNILDACSKNGAHDLPFREKLIDLLAVLREEGVDMEIVNQLRVRLAEVVDMVGVKEKPVRASRHKKKRKR